MLDIEQRAELIRKRVLALGFAESVFKEAEDMCTRLGMKLPGAARSLWQEWLNDQVATSNDVEFRIAAHDPGLHFLEWLKVRCTQRYRVTWRAMEKLSKTYGPETATHFMGVVWRQELAWAQRMRTYDNPHVATRAALFLRETEGRPAKTFAAIADIFVATAMKSEFMENAVREMSADEIRYAETLPEFTPLFLQYASKAYREVIDRMDRTQLQALADRAKRDELLERDIDIARSMAASTRRFPMRHEMSVIRAAMGLKIGPNELYLIEDSFVKSLESGSVHVERGTRTPQVLFLSTIADQKQRRNLMLQAIAPDPNASADIWEIARLDRRWLDGLPTSFKSWPALRDSLEAWKLKVVEGRRKIPYDRISDFGFFIAGRNGNGGGGKDVR